MTAIIPFTFEAAQVRVIDRAGEPWFVLTDVCTILEVGNASMTASRLDDDEKAISNVDTLGGAQNATIINESGLWSVVLTSRKENAKRFKKWLTSEVIPSIRKTGLYSARVLTPAEQNLANARLAVEFERRQIALEQAQAISNATSERALELAAIAEAKSQATAMACQDYSIMAYSRLCGIPVDLDTARKLGTKAGNLSRSRGLPIGKARDPRFGSVNTYIESVLQEVFTEGL